LRIGRDGKEVREGSRERGEGVREGWERRWRDMKGGKRKGGEEN